MNVISIENINKIPQPEKKKKLNELRIKIGSSQNKDT
jgi:hypothetical protein